MTDNSSVEGRLVAVPVTRCAGPAGSAAGVPAAGDKAGAQLDSAGHLDRPVVRSDGNGATRLFTSWLATRQPARWNDYRHGATTHAPAAWVSL